MEELTNEEIVLAGLGDLGRRTGRMNLRKAVRHELGASRFRKQFLERVHKLPKPVQKALIEGKAQISDAPYYATAAIKGTRAELIKLSQPEELGITNIDNGKLGKDKFFTLSAIRLLFDDSEAKGTFTTPYPKQLLNAEWELELNGKKVFEKMPVRKFFDGFYGYNVQKPFGLYVLNNPKIIEPQTPIEFNVTLPDALNGYLKIFLEGTTVYSY
ncbi:MAG: hypothetical protein D6707_10295 [Bacteroidetes bacterium]|jgi:hypothetical protein|nr:MAG: hypothetical protein D6707_10295 [Bacteroidota bacterium]